MTTTQIVKRFGSVQIAANVADQKIEFIQSILDKFSLSSGTKRRYENQLIEWNKIKSSCKS